MPPVLAGGFDALLGHCGQLVDLQDTLNLREEAVDEPKVAAGDAGTCSNDLEDPCLRDCQRTKYAVIRPHSRGEASRFGNVILRRTLSAELVFGRGTSPLQTHRGSPLDRVESYLFSDACSSYTRPYVRGVPTPAILGT